MSLYTSPVPSDASAANELWKFLTPPGPDNIEMDASKGVTGMNTGYTLDPKNRLLLIANLIAFIRQLSPVDTLTHGIAANSAGMAYQNTLTTVNYQNVINSGGITDQASQGAADSRRVQTEITVQQTVQNTGTGEISDKIQNRQQIANRVANLNNEVSIDHNATSNGISVKLGGVEQLAHYIDKNKFAVSVGGVDLFFIRPSGHICTNQNEGLTAVDPTPVSRIPVFDQADTLLGYISLQVDP